MKEILGINENQYFKTNFQEQYDTIMHIYIVNALFEIEGTKVALKECAKLINP